LATGRHAPPRADSASPERSRLRSLASVSSYGVAAP